MTYEDTDNYEHIDSSEGEATELTQDTLPESDKDSQVRKRIDDLLEKKRLRELLDDTDDW